MRTLPYNFEQTLKQNMRRPDFKILAFDPARDTMSAVVSGTYAQIPLDLTPYCSSISWTPAKLSFVLEDPDILFHPDLGSQKNYLADGAIIRLREGDTYLDEPSWINTFTGIIQGQIGWQESRRSKNLEAKITVYSRDNSQSWKRRSITTREYSAGTEVGLILYDICTGFMGMTTNEIRIPATLGLQTKHQITQIAQVAPWEAITTILESVGGVPFFDGDGRLSCYSKVLSNPEVRTWTNEILDYEVPEFNQETYNRIRVIFLDSTLDEVDSACQCLGTATATAGFFMPGIKLKTYWSDDHRQRAKNTFMLVKQSCVTQVGRFMTTGFGPWAKEKYSQEDDFHGQIKIEVPIYSPILFGLSLAEYMVMAFFPDDVVTFGFGATEGITIPIGRLREAASLIMILALMMCIGTGNYEIWGTPYDMAYCEKESMATVCNLNYWDINERTIKNDLLGSYDQADAIALMELIFEKSRSYPRKLVLQDDPSLELGDMGRMPDGRKFFITDMQKTLKRGEVPILSLDGFKAKRA